MQLINTLIPIVNYRVNYADYLLQYEQIINFSANEKYFKNTAIF